MMLFSGHATEINGTDVCLACGAALDSDAPGCFTYGTGVHDLPRWHIVPDVAPP